MSGAVCAPYKSPLLRQVTGPTLRPGGLELTDRAVYLCGFRPGDMLADLGCGLGASAVHLASEHGMQMLAIDLSQDMLAEAEAMHHDLTFIQANAQAIPLADKCLDGVLCECVLSLSGEPQAMLRECRRVLKPGGHMVISDLYLRNPPPEGCGLPLNGCLGGASSKADIQAMINKAGMELVLWEEHSRLLSRLAAQLVWKHGSAAALWGVCKGDDDCAAAAMISQARPGYFLLTARRMGTTLDETMIRVMRLSAQGLYCSQIIMALALETAGFANPELIRSMAGLAFGCGTGQGSCGVLTGAACVLALHAGKGGAGEEESPAFMPMLEELSDWFAAHAGGQDGAVTCEAIIGPGADHTPQQKCGALVGEAFVKAMEILTSNGFDPTGIGNVNRA